MCCGGGGGIGARLATLQEIPEWYDAYDFVLYGYRLNYSLKDCIKSICTKHNETIVIIVSIITMIVIVL